MPGYKYNMPDILASIGLVEIERYSEVLEKRKSIFNAYTKGFENCSWAHTPLYITDQKESSYHIYALRIRNITEQKRDEIMKKIVKKGVSVNVHFQPIPLFSFYKQLGYNILDYPNSFKNYAAEISLPVYYDLTGIQLEHVIEMVKESVEEVIG